MPAKGSKAKAAAKEVAADQPAVADQSAAVEITAEKKVAKKRVPRGNKKLVIVESPAKARTIARYLGAPYEVKASMGHVRDLPKKELGVDIENGFTPKYVTLRGKNISDLRRAAKSAVEVYLAPDPDREGEAIAWHLAKVLEISEERTFRVAFNEITEKAIKAAFLKPGKIDMARVDAQQARRVLDRLVGYRLSPFLWRKIAKGLSAGRVQSVALKLCAEREKEIRAFKSEEHWKVVARLKAAAGEFQAELREVDRAPMALPNEAATVEVLTEIEKCAFRVEAANGKLVLAKAPPPFITSLLQQAASVQLNFTARKTMTIAQQLYEGVDLGEGGPVGLITYMRTDSFRVTEDAISAARAIVAERFGPQYLPPKPNTFASRRGAQEAHEAVRPTDPNRAPETVEKYLTVDQAKLYRLIWNRFIASQMESARYQVGLADIVARRGESGREFLFRAKGRHVEFAGHTVLSQGAEAESRSHKELPLPPLTANEELGLQGLDKSQHFTQPPPRYTEASLIRTLEKEGIGRPSTYATIVSTILDRGYVRRERRQLVPSELGIMVSDALAAHFPTIMDLGFTREMEDKLDSIENSQRRWTDVLAEFHGPFAADLAKAEENMTKLKGAQPEIPVNCEKCGKPMVIRVSRGGPFLGCSGFPDCRNAKPLPGEERPEAVETEYQCPRCGKHLLLRSGRRGKFFACSGYPDCRYSTNFGPDGKPMILPEPTESCPNCGTRLVIKLGRRGPFMACPGYPKCKFAKGLEGPAAGLPEVKEACDKCGKPMVARWGRRGPFIACSGYPDCKNAKPCPQKDGAGETVPGDAPPAGADEVSDVSGGGAVEDLPPEG